MDPDDRLTEKLGEELRRSMAEIRLHHEFREELKGRLLATPPSRWRRWLNSWPALARHRGALGGIAVAAIAAAVLVPEGTASRFLREAKESRDLSVEDLRDVFSVSYEMAAHRFTNLATHHLGLTCHFVKNDSGGTIYKAYENDGVTFPADAAGAIEGQRMCRYWSGRQVFASADRFSPYFQYSDTPAGTYWCTAQVDAGPQRGFAITLGVPYEDSRWFRDRETTRRLTSACPDGDCCQRPPAALAARWEGMAWPSARANSHVLLALPAGSFPGVDEAEVLEFLERHDKD